MSPLFYEKPQLLSLHLHRIWRMRRGNYGYAKQANAVPAVLNEFAAVSRHDPLVFAADTAAPLCVLGLERSNLFVEDSAWTEEIYVPAYVRRYPFLSMAFEGDAHTVLAIDGAAERFVPDATDDDAAALFEGDAPLALTKQMLSFCETFLRDQIETLACANALDRQGLLHEQQAQVVMPGGRKITLRGFVPWMRRRSRGSMKRSYGIGTAAAGLAGSTCTWHRCNASPICLHGRHGTNRSRRPCSQHDIAMILNISMQRLLPTFCTTKDKLCVWF